MITSVMYDNVTMVTMEKSDLYDIVCHIVADTVLDAVLESTAGYTPEAEDDVAMGNIVDNILVADKFSLGEALAQIRHGVHRKDFPGIIARLMAFKYSCESRKRVDKELENMG